MPDILYNIIYTVVCLLSLSLAYWFCKIITEKTGSTSDSKYVVIIIGTFLIAASHFSLRQGRLCFQPVYITGTRYYHTKKDCKYIKNKDFETVFRMKAIEQGRKKCEECEYIEEYELEEARSRE